MSPLQLLESFYLAYDQIGQKKLQSVIIYIHFILCQVIDKKICLQCLSLQSLSQLTFTVANKLTTKSVLCDSISFLPLYVGKCHNFKELHITILRLVLFNACFVPIFTFSFLSLSFHSPNLEPLEYHKRCYVCLFSTQEYVTRMARGQKLREEVAPTAYEGQLYQHCLLDVGVFFFCYQRYKKQILEMLA